LALEPAAAWAASGLPSLRRRRDGGGLAGVAGVAGRVAEVIVPKFPTAWAVAAAVSAPEAGRPAGRRRREGGDGTAKGTDGGSAGGGGGKRMGGSVPMLTLESELLSGAKESEEPLSGEKGST